ncbi:MAG TPA: hypothetical protein P5511_09180, partial [Candidatus Goldiibacteriota bacterium]|nr:hypothetical protein [Candidatus Goldiibacteriota bacterium]
MKTVIAALLAFLACVVTVVAQDSDEKAAYAMFDARNSVTDTARAVENADKCVAAMENLLSKRPSDKNLFMYAKAIDFRYYHLPAGREEAKAAFKKGMEKAEAFCTANTQYARSAYALCGRMTFIGRYSELIDLMEAATSGYAGRIKDMAEKLYSVDPEFGGGSAAYTLGRLHYKAPNIIFILTWPDKRLSKKYFEEFLSKSPGSLYGKIFLADTLWELGEKERAVRLY